MATVAEVMDDVAGDCSVSPPPSWISATSLSYVELKRFLRQTVDELLDRVDWPDPIATDTVITGTGDETYALPSDFKRLTRDPLTVYETTTTRRRGIPVPTNGAWTHLKDLGSAGGDRYFRLSGDEASGFDISFWDNPTSGVSITVSYISKNWLSLAGTAGSTWTDVAATLLLPRDLVEMGTVWRFRRKKGLPYADRMNEYEAKLARRANDARVIRSVNMTGGQRLSPFQVPVPDFIPPS